MIRERFLCYLARENLFVFSLMRDVMLFTELSLSSSVKLTLAADRLTVKADALAAEAAKLSAGIVRPESGCEYVTRYSFATESHALKYSPVPQVKEFHKALKRAAVKQNPDVGTRGLVFSGETELCKKGADFCTEAVKFFNGLSSLRGKGKRTGIPYYVAAAFSSFASACGTFLRTVIKEQYAALDTVKLSDAMIRYINSFYSPDNPPLKTGDDNLSGLDALAASVQSFDGIAVALDIAVKINRKRLNTPVSEVKGVLKSG